MSAIFNRQAATALIALCLFPRAGVTQELGARTGWIMPYERSFWKYAGVDFGVSEFHPSCQYANPRCDGDAHTAGIFVGGNFSEHLGLELAYFKLGEIQTGGGGTADGKTSARGFNVSLTAGFPVSTNTVIVGKLGEVFGRSNVAGNAPGLITATRSGWGPSLGAGVRVKIAPDWALRLDADRYRLHFADGERGRSTGLPRVCSTPSEASSRGRKAARNTCFPQALPRRARARPTRFCALLVFTQSRGTIAPEGWDKT